VPGYAKEFLDVQEYSSHQHNIELENDVIHQPHMLKCNAVMCFKAKLTCI
jgi:hypothetical protein